MAIRAAILRPFVVGSEQLLIYILLDAAAIRQLIPDARGALHCLSIISLLQRLCCWPSAAFFRRNQEQYRRFSAVQAA